MSCLKISLSAKNEGPAVTSSPSKYAGDRYFSNCSVIKITNQWQGIKNMEEEIYRVFNKQLVKGLKYCIHSFDSLGI